jgi:hypothetical protein
MDKVVHDSLQSSTASLIVNKINPEFMTSTVRNEIQVIFALRDSKTGFKNYAFSFLFEFLPQDFIYISMNSQSHPIHSIISPLGIFDQVLKSVHSLQMLCLR